MNSSISGLREALSSLGISTTTPGLRGEKRLEVLKNRYEAAKDESYDKEEKTTTSSSSSKHSNNTNDDNYKLTIVQLRRKCESLGINTSTPGLKGQERKEELLSRIASPPSPKKKTCTSPKKTTSPQRRRPRINAIDLRDDNSTIQNHNHNQTDVANVKKLNSKIAAIRKTRMTCIATETSALASELTSLQQVLNNTDNNITTTNNDTLELKKIHASMKDQAIERITLVKKQMAEIQTNHRNHTEHGIAVELELLSSLRELTSDLKEEDNISKISRAEQLARQAFFSQKSGNTREAHELYLKALAQDSELGIANLNFALFCQHELKDYDTASEHFKKAIASKSSNAYIFYSMFLYKVQKDEEMAKATFLKGLEAHSRNVRLNVEYATFCQHHTKDFIDARLYLEKAIKLADDDVLNTIQSQYAALLASDYYKEYNLAEKYYKKSIASNSDANLVVNYANYLKKRGKLLDAKDMYGKSIAIEKSTKNGSVTNNSDHVMKNYAIFLRDCPEMRKSGNTTTLRGNETPRDRQEYLSGKARVVMNDLLKSSSTASGCNINAVARNQTSSTPRPPPPS